MIPIYVVTSKRYHKLLPGFAYLWNIFASSLASVVVVTDAIPKGIHLPPNFEVRSVTGGFPVGKEKWSDCLIEALTHCPQSHLLLMLDDYWLVRSVPDGAIPTLAEYATLHPEILRVDLTDDRQFNGAAKSIGSWGSFDMVETPPESAYQMSLQAAIWSRDHLLSILRPGLSPWQVELQTSLAERPDLRVCGTAQRPLHYINVSTGGDDKRVLSYSGLPEEHRKHMEAAGWL